MRENGNDIELVTNHNLSGPGTPNASQKIAFGSPINLTGNDEKEADESLGLNTDEKPAEKFSLSDCSLYTLFLVLFSTVAIMQKPRQSYMVTKQIRNQLTVQGYPNDNDNDDTEFYDIIQPADMWNYMREMLVPVLMPCEEGKQGCVYGSDFPGVIAQQNSLMGGFQLRLNRVNDGKCFMQEVKAGNIFDGLPSCSPRFSGDSESTDDFTIAAWPQQFPCTAAPGLGTCTGGATTTEAACTMACSGNGTKPDTPGTDCHSAAGTNTWAAIAQSVCDTRVGTQADATEGNCTGAGPECLFAATVLPEVTLKYSNVDWVLDAENKVRVGAPTFQSVSDSYPDAGYSGEALFFDKNNLTQEEAINRLSQLEAGGLFSEQARQLVVDSTLYNANLNLHSVSRLSFEMTEAGGVDPYMQMKTWRFLRYSGNMGKILHVLWWIFVGFVIYFTLLELYELWKDGCGGYFADAWNYVDILNLTGFYFTIGTNLYTMNYEVELANVHMKAYDMPCKASTCSDELLLSRGTCEAGEGAWTEKCAPNEPKELMFTNIDGYTSFRYLQFQYMAENYFVCLNGFLLWVKMFKYMTFSARIRFLFDIIAKSASELFFFCVVMFVLILAFAMSGYLMFSTDVHMFRSFPHAIMNLFIAFVGGEMDYEELRRSGGPMAGGYYILWNLACVLILVNVFIAILCEAYSQVTEEMEENQSPIWDRAKLFWKNVKGKIGGNKLADLFKKSSPKIGTDNDQPQLFSHASMDVDGDGMMEQHEIAAKLGIDKGEAASIVEQFDKDGDGMINADEYNDLKRVATEKTPTKIPKNLAGKLNAIEDAIMALAKSSHQSVGLGDDESTKTIVKLALRNFKNEIHKELKTMQENLGNEVTTRCDNISKQIRRLDTERNERFKQMQDQTPKHGTAQLDGQKQRYFDLFMLKEKFAELDTTGDGGIDIDEFRSVLQEMELAVPSVLVSKLFAALDKDGNGRLELNEFVSIIEDSSRSNPNQDFPTVFKRAITRHLAEYHLSPLNSRPQ